MTSERQEYVAYRLQRSRETLVEAEAMVGMGHLIAAVNKTGFTTLLTGDAISWRSRHQVHPPSWLVIKSMQKRTDGLSLSFRAAKAPLCSSSYRTVLMRIHGASM